MMLCRVCNSANSGHFREGGCDICRGGALGTDGMIEKAIAMLRADKARSFSISTEIPREWLAAEEKAWDERLEGAESVKNLLNRLIVSRIRESAGIPYAPDGECRAVFDYASGAVSLRRNDMFVFGRYRKLSAGLSQSRWPCSKCEGRGCPSCGGKGRMYDSVEERIGEPAKSAFSAGGYVLHASGREDVDATNSAGRPFVLQIKEPAERDADLPALEREIGSGGEVSVSDLRLVPRGFVEVVTESHFDKTYEAEVEFDREPGEEGLGRIRAIEGRTLLQQTPSRVAHRRADLVRHRKVRRMEIAGSEGKRATLLVNAEAGTYIKELISGDGGRTVPSVAGELGFPAVCRKLAVTGIDDAFLDLCLAAMR
jgi:tRNA pseudouridine synthase 10